MVSELARVHAEHHGPLCIVRVQGEIDISNEQEVGATIEGAVTNRSVTVVVDLSETSYLDSSGVALLLRLGERLRTRRQRLSLLVPEESPVRVALELTGLPSSIRMGPRMDDVLPEGPRQER